MKVMQISSLDGLRRRGLGAILPSEGVTLLNTAEAQLSEYMATGRVSDVRAGALSQRIADLYRRVWALPENGPVPAEIERAIRQVKLDVHRAGWSFFGLDYEPWMPWAAGAAVLVAGGGYWAYRRWGKRRRR